MADINSEALSAASASPASDRADKAPLPAPTPASSRSSSCCSLPIATSRARRTPCSPSIGLGRAHHRVLHFVNRNPGLRVADLLEVLKITKQSLARVLKQLVDNWPSPLSRCR